MADMILAERTAKDLIRLLQQDPDLYANVLTWFGPFCDCNVADYVIAGIEANDFFVMQMLMLLMGPQQISVPHAPRTDNRVQGMLISTYCADTTLVGLYGTATAETYTRPLVSNHPGCQP